MFPRLIRLSLSQKTGRTGLFELAGMIFLEVFLALIAFFHDPFEHVE